jgi:hypothetical protein
VSFPQLKMTDPLQHLSEGKIETVLGYLERTGPESADLSSSVKAGLRTREIACPYHGE